MDKVARVKDLGGNQYEVTVDTYMDGVLILSETSVEDLDGFTCMSDEDYNKVKAVDLQSDDMISPQHADNLLSRAAIEFAARYSGFDVEEFKLSKGK